MQGWKIPLALPWFKKGRKASQSSRSWNLTASSCRQQLNLRNYDLETMTENLHRRQLRLSLSQELPGKTNLFCLVSKPISFLYTLEFLLLPFVTVTLRLVPLMIICQQSYPTFWTISFVYCLYRLYAVDIGDQQDQQPTCDLVCERRLMKCDNEKLVYLFIYQWQV